MDAAGVFASTTNPCAQPSFRHRMCARLSQLSRSQVKVVGLTKGARRAPIVLTPSMMKRSLLMISLSCPAACSVVPAIERSSLF